MVANLPCPRGSSLFRPAMSDVTHILSAIENGDAHAAEELLPLVYDQLRQLAARRLAREAPGNTLQPTALVHEAYLRLVDVEKAQHWDSRGHFFAAAAEAMRRILVENARRKKRHKRGGGRRRVELTGQDLAVATDPDELLALDEALTKLAAEDALAASVAKLRLYAGLSVEQAGTAMGISRANAYRQWTYANAWLQSAVRGPDESPAS
jgi:RNA polymerase sigma factor (TIGR02999 family)